MIFLVNALDFFFLGIVQFYYFFQKLRLYIFLVIPPNVDLFSDHLMSVFLERPLTVGVST